MGNSSSANTIRRPKANLDSSQELQALSSSLMHERPSPLIIKQEQNSDRIISINNHAFVERRAKYTKDLRESLDPRDKEVVIPFQTSFNITKLQRENKGKKAKMVYQLNGDENKKKIQEMKKESTKLIQSQEYFKMRREIYDYISEVCQNINSIVFQLLNEGKLTQNQAKALAAKNILTNVQSVLAQVKKKFSQTLLSIAKEIEQLMVDLTKSIDGQLKEIMSQLASHYPQATVTGQTARMKEVITDVNRSQDQTTDLIFVNKIDIQNYINGSYYSFYSQQQNTDPQIFTGFIMQVINKAINITKQPFSKESDQTIFEKFHQFSQSLFSFGQRITTNKCTGDKIIPYFKQILRSSNPNKSQKNKQTIPETSKLMYHGVQKSFNFIEERQSLNNDLQLMRAHHKFGIAQKIPNHVKPFTDVAIQNANFEVHNSSVLRIMTKWAEYLQDIFQKPQVHIMQRVYNFKSLKNEYNLKCMQIKDKICNDLITEYSYVKKQLKDMREKNSLFQSHILCQTEAGTTYLKRFTEARSSSTQLNTILIQFTRKYLCVLIHHLIRAGCLNQSINLVMFRVGDLLRSKLQCSESSFINIVKMLYLLDQSKEMEGKFKLVRIKNKLNDKDNNILINYMFMGKVQCQLQLSIQDMAKKDKNYYAFTHFLYQLTRGKFGVLTECATIVSQHDPIVNSSKDIYYRPKHYEKIQKGKEPTHSIHIKDNNIYKCWKCHQLVLMENTQLFVKQQTTCNQCISKEKNSQSKFVNQDIKGLIYKLQSIKDNEGNNLFQRLDHYGQIEKGKYILSISNRKARDLKQSVKLFRVWYDKNEIKLLMVDINNQLLTAFHKQKLDFSEINYFDISNQNKKQEKLNEITYKCDKQTLKPIFGFMNIYAEFISELDDFFEKFEKFRCQRHIINIIKSKSEIIDMRSDSDNLVALNEITYAYGENDFKKLLYKKCNVIDYKYIKTINFKALKLKEKPLSLNYMDSSIEINLNQNGISQITFQNQRKLEKLEIFHNQLDSIDLKNNTTLTYLNLKENMLTSINLSNNINLAHLYLEGNNLASIDLTKNINLTKFSIQNNKLTQIDLSNNLKLTDLNLAGNYLTSCICWFLSELSNNLILWNMHSQICQVTLLYRKGQLKKCQIWGYMVVDELNCSRELNNDKCNFSYKIQERP